MDPDGSPQPQPAAEDEDGNQEQQPSPFPHAASAGELGMMLTGAGPPSLRRRANTAAPARYPRAGAPPRWDRHKTTETASSPPRRHLSRTNPPASAVKASRAYPPAVACGEVYALDAFTIG